MVRRASSYLLVAVLALTLLATMAGAGAAPRLPDLPNPKVEASAPEVGKYGGTFITSSFSDPRTFNPVASQDTVSNTVVEAIADALVDQNYLTGEIEPALAESWTVSRDGRTWTFTLRNKLVWSDGQPLTVDDVVFTMQAIFTQGVDTSYRDIMTFKGERVQWRSLMAGAFSSRPPAASLQSDCSSALSKTSPSSRGTN